MKTHRLATAAMASVMIAGTLTAGLAAASPAGADTALPGSIVLLKDYNIWLVRPDGTGLVQVTKDGTYASQYYSPSMADDGTIAAGKGANIVRLKQNGNVLNTMDPPPLTNSAGQPQDGTPSNVAISPDGTKIAWSTASYTCPVGTDCTARPVTGVTSSTALTPPTTTSYYGDPSWVTNNRLMVHGGYLSQMMLQDVGGAAEHWFDDKDYASSSTDLGDGWVSRDGRVLVAKRGYGSATRIFTFKVTGDPRTGAPSTLPTPSPDCATNEDAKLSSPTLAPDASGFAVADSAGISVIRLAATCDGNTSAAIVPGGSMPFWSPAAISPDAGTNPQPTPVPPPAPTKFSVVTKSKVQGKLAVGKTLRAKVGTWTPTPTSIKFSWMRNGKAIRKATKKAYNLTRADRGKRIALKITVRGQGLPAAKTVVKAGRVRR